MGWATTRFLDFQLTVIVGSAELQTVNHCNKSSFYIYRGIYAICCYSREPYHPQLAAAHFSVTRKLSADIWMKGRKDNAHRTLHWRPVTDGQKDFLGHWQHLEFHLLCLGFPVFCTGASGRNRQPHGILQWRFTTMSLKGGKSVLTSSMSTWHKSGSSERREPQLKKMSP